MKFLDRSSLTMLNKIKISIRPNEVVHWSRMSLRKFLLDLDLYSVVDKLIKADHENGQQSNYGHFKFYHMDHKVEIVLDGICNCGSNVIKIRKVVVEGDNAVKLNKAILDQLPAK